VNKNIIENCVELCSKTDVRNDCFEPELAIMSFCPGLHNKTNIYKARYTCIYILHQDILSRSLGKNTSYHPCVIIIQYNSKKGMNKE
jgi:hypothetical protein